MLCLPNSAWVAPAIIFFVAMLVRIPSSYESFWVDELHSAWCVWDSLGDVSNRATLGNQSPIYFGGLWFWKQAFGGSEFALRMSSVLMTSIAASVMTVGVSRWSTSSIAGVASGLVIALESNAIFYGTELRPYAAVILCASVSTLCFVRLLGSADSSGVWYGLVISSLIATVMQPTALAVLSVFFAVLAMQRITRRQFSPRLSLSNLLLVAAAVAVGWMLWETTLNESWRSRSDWGSFAMAPSFWQAVGIWEWTWLWMMPLLVCLFFRLKLLSVLCIAIIIGSTTFAFWASSRLGWVHLWNRRYFIGLLPMFALLVGAAVAQFKRSRKKSHWVQLACMTLLLAGLTWSQGVAQTLVRSPSMLAHRGEDWRSAVGWVQSELKPNDAVWLDPGLIESRILTEWRTIDPPPTMDNLRYLRYPVSGPYRLAGVRVIPPIHRPQYGEERIAGRFRPGSSDKLWVIARASMSTARAFANYFLNYNLNLPAAGSEPEVRSYGGITVIRFAMDVTGEKE